MVGIDRRTGRTVAGWDLFLVHVEDVLTTALGSRQKRREYGSRLPELLAKNVGERLQMLAMVYAAQAFASAENQLASRFVLERVVAQAVEGGLVLRFWGRWQGGDVSFDVRVLRGV